MPQLPGRPASLACVECRKKHLRCDGKTPVCTRCAYQKLSCNYTPSRRGLNRRASSKPKGPEARDLYQSPESITSTTQVSPATISQTLSPALTTVIGIVEYRRGNEQDRNAFYACFHPAHPILVPYKFRPLDYPVYLDLLIDYIGQRCRAEEFLDQASADTIAYAMGSLQDETTVYRVQALIMYSIILHSDRNANEALQCLARAARISNTLQIWTAGESGLCSQENNPIKLESIRRTFWELHILSIYYSALHQCSSLSVDLAATPPDLPCSEDSFAAGQVPCLGQKFASLETRFFDTDPASTGASSYAYRIEAVRLMRRVHKLPSEASAAAVQSVNSALASWAYYAPDVHRKSRGMDGQVDPLCFQAHMLVHCASIFLHFPRSNLPSNVPTSHDIQCASSCQRSSYPISSHHAVNAIAASNEIANLASLPWSSINSTPLFICALILGAIVQLAVATAHQFALETDCLQQYSDRISLILGLLKRYGKQWPVAEHAHTQLRAVAAVIFAPKNWLKGVSQHVTISESDSGLDVTETASTMSWFELFSNDELQSTFT